MTKEQCEALVWDSIAAYLFEMTDSTEPGQPLNCERVLQTLDYALTSAVITATEHEALLHRYQFEMNEFLYPGSAEKELKAWLNQDPLFEVHTSSGMYICTPSIKTTGFQVSFFAQHAQEWVAISDRQCPSINALLKVLDDLGIVYPVFCFKKSLLNHE